MRQLRSAMRRGREPIVPYAPHAPTTRLRRTDGQRKKKFDIDNSDDVVKATTWHRSVEEEEKMDEYGSGGGSGDKGLDDEGNTPPLPERVPVYSNNSNLVMVSYMNKIFVFIFECLAETDFEKS